MILVKKVSKSLGLSGSHQNVVNIINTLSSDRYAVDLQDFISFTEQVAFLSRPAAHHPTDDYAVMFVPNGHTLNNVKV